MNLWESGKEIMKKCRKKDKRNRRKEEMIERLKGETYKDGGRHKDFWI
jgi:hypothetical protein